MSSTLPSIWYCIFNPIHNRNCKCLIEEPNDWLLPEWCTSNLLFELLLLQLQDSTVVNSSASLNVDFVNIKPVLAPFANVDLVTNVTCKSEWNTGVILEKIADISFTSVWEQSNPELSNQNQSVDDDREPRSPHSGVRNETQRFQRNTVVLQSRSPSQVTNTKGRPNEDNG